MTDYIAPALTLIGVLATAYFSWNGVKTNDSTDRLSKAAGLYSNYAENIEARLLRLETRLEDTEAERDEYRDKTEEYHTLLLDILRWLIDVVAWESRDRLDPPPAHSLSAILDKLTEFIEMQKKSQKKSP